MHIIAIIIVVALALYLITGNFDEFLITIENGEIIKQKGRIAPKLLNDFKPALSGVRSGKVIGNKYERGIKLTFRGDIDEFTEQRLRNIVGLYYG
ncbi:MAG: DUF3634 family protein [Kangiellaceae bacterium]|nr:DUF3634 family protein [Kangiellaceae bacterium]